VPNKSRRKPKTKSAVDAVSKPPSQVDTRARDLGGSASSAFNWELVRRVSAAIVMLGPDAERTVEDRLEVICTALDALKPQDAIEGMIAAQAVALHFGAMEALRRSMAIDQPAEIAARLRKDGANLARAMTDMVDALDRKRGKAQQVVRVERVVVEDGGQAIVGVANALGGRRCETEA
jgi:hypothetical protein